MPGLNGFEVAEKIREQDRHVLIFFLSDRSDKNDRLKGFSLRGNDYLANLLSGRADRPYQGPF